MLKSSTSEGSEAYIALGANLGDREATLMQAISLLHAHPEIEVLRCSKLYETDPVGMVDQPNFVNMAVALRTTLEPEALLHVMLDTELKLGRERTIRWGPRTVDLDLLWMQGRQMDTELLTLPHPRMMERAFVLVPMAVLVTEEEAELKEQIQAALNVLDGKDGVRLWKTCTWPSVSEHSAN